MTIERTASFLFGANAIINWTLAARGIVDPAGMAAAYGGPAPNYVFMVRLWSGLVFMFGCLFWEVSRDVRGKLALAKYNWIEKSVTAVSVTLGFLAGDVPGRLMLLIFLTNWLWIPVLLYVDIALRRVRS